MAQWEYTTLAMFRPDKKGRRWLRLSTDPNTVGAVGEQVGEAEKPRFLGSLWQAARLLESALKEMDAEGWELVSHSFNGPGFGGLTGTAVLRRPANKIEENTD